MNKTKTTKSQTFDSPIKFNITGELDEVVQCYLNS